MEVNDDFSSAQSSNPPRRRAGSMFGVDDRLIARAEDAGGDNPVVD
jgi:hypothetical protein